MKKIAIVPIDNRPICYTLLANICAIDKDIKLFMPKRDFLGGLKTSANINEILSWLNDLPCLDYLIISLDTIAYGGLVASRRCDDTEDEIKSRILKMCEIIKKKNCKVFAHSSIMRISNNNINEEEKEYWNVWGKKIFEYSYFTHKARKKMTETCVTNKIPSNILNDYLNTRKRNFEINFEYLKLLEENLFDFLIFSKDDCAKYGLNVEEAQILEDFIKEHKLSATVKTGADEIPLLLLSRAIAGDREVKIAPIFKYPKSTNLISKYEDIPIFDCVSGQIEMAGAKINNENPDLSLYVNNFKAEQGDNVLGDLINCFEGELNLPKTPYFIADINNANGADNALLEKFLNSEVDENFYGYAGYNTSANTLGCAICTACAKYFAKNYDARAYCMLQFIRFLDDYAYQANIRRTGGTFFEFENKINKFLKTGFCDVKYRYPWNRSFEIEIIL